MFCLNFRTVLQLWLDQDRHQILDGTVPAFGTGRYRPRILEDPRALAVHLELFQTQLPKQALCAGPSEGNPFIAEGWARKSQAGGGPR